uniref:Transmembrane protein n=1 Tax=Strongyloides venezuelensis TaxID=75913 RepID=A0A0K0FR70_STRVS
MENTWRWKLGCLYLLAGLIFCIFLMVVIIKFMNCRHRNQVLILESGHRRRVASETSRVDRLERIVRRLQEEKKEWENKEKKEE